MCDSGLGELISEPLDPEPEFYRDLVKPIECSRPMILPCSPSEPSISDPDDAIIINPEAENIIEPPRGKTKNVVSEQVRHKPTCTSTEKS